MASTGGAILYSEQLPPAVMHRRSANYQPKTWDYDSICSMQQANKMISVEPSEQISTVKTSLKQRVRQLLLKEDQELATRLRIIDQLQSLGVAYHFQEEIKRLLMSMHDAHLQLKHDLSSTALMFRMLRSHAIPASIDMFNAFSDGNGDLEAASPCSVDVDGFIALYEASYLAFPQEETMLDRAREYAIKKLQELMPSTEHYQREKVRAVLLDLPLHWRAPRLQTAWSLKEHRDNWESCGCRSIDSSIRQMAALDFNQVQAMHRSELLEVTTWWKESRLGEKLPFARDRLVECFFCAACIAPEPHLAGRREVLAKVGSLIVHLDDVYDVYGTLEELDEFTDAIAAWDESSAEALPEYMKAMYATIRATSTAAADRVMKEQGYDVLPLYKKAAESERGEGPLSIACLMAESGDGATEKEARVAVADAIAETWKEVNAEVALSNTGEADRVCINLARIIQCIYRDGDDITSPSDNRKRLIKDLFFTPADANICDADALA
ncbi:unnamed protein product [Alopecurus aequalis]